ncbi:MAG: hypothetical protein ACC657_10385 [Thiohalomonadales bacterium]
MTSKNEIRKSVRNILKLLSSKEQQLEYQQKFSSANVALDLLCMWFNDLYNPGSHLFKHAFTPVEMKLIQKFNRNYDLFKRKVPETIDELHQDNHWKSIMLEAQKLLDKISEL